MTETRHPPREGDLPRAEIMALAQRTIDRNPGAEVHFKFTCEACGERCTLSEPNMLRERGEWFACGHETTIGRAGFLLTQVLR